MLGPPADAVDVTIGLLGPFVLRVRGRSVPVRSPQHRTLLAALALQTGQVVTVRDLVAAVWTGMSPATPGAPCSWRWCGCGRSSPRRAAPG